MCKRCYLLFLFFISCGCSSPGNQIKNKVSQEFSLSVIADSIRYVPLETKGNVLVKYLNECHIDDDNIFIRDEKKVSCFSIEGKFICNVGSIGQGPSEYLCCGAFDIDTKKKEIYLYSIFDHKILVYNYNGVLLHKISVKKAVSGIQICNDFAYMNIDRTDYDQGIDSVFVLNLIDKSFIQFPGRIVGVDKSKEEVNIRINDRLVGDTAVDVLYIYSKLEKKDSIFISQKKEPEKDFFYPKLLLRDKNIILGNMQQEISFYKKKFDRQLKSGRIVHYSTTSPTPSKPVVYNISEEKYISMYNQVDAIYNGILNDLGGVPDFYVKYDFIGFYPFCIEENNTLCSVLGVEYVLNSGMLNFHIKEDDNPIVIITYLKK